MARKLKGKIGIKGLKGSLLRHQAKEQFNAKLKKKQQHELNKGKPTKAAAKSRANQEKSGLQFIPFDKNSTLLLVGEGDFSFARSILQADYILPENLIVTSYDASIAELNLKYPHTFQENYDFLIDQGVNIFFRIDATNFLKSFKLTKKTPWTKILGPEWHHKYLQNIMFNFPHTGRGIKDQDRNIREHQELMFGYFNSCKQLFQLVNNDPKKTSAKQYTAGYSLSPDGKDNGLEENGLGKVIVSLFTGEPYDSWQIKVLAKNSGWKIERSNKFQWDQYPEYHHKRTNSELDTTKPATERDARVYVLEAFNKNKHVQSKKKQTDSDNESD